MVQKRDGRVELLYVVVGLVSLVNRRRDDIQSQPIKLPTYS